MARVSEADVKELIDTNRNVDPFIAVATLIVDEELVGLGMTAARLTQVEMYLAAHFTALTEERGGLVRTQIDETEDQVASVFDKGFLMTRFGQTALSLDSSGRLAEIGNPGQQRKAQFRVIESYPRPVVSS